MHYYTWLAVAYSAFSPEEGAEGHGSSCSDDVGQSVGQTTSEQNGTVKIPFSNEDDAEAARQGQRHPHLPQQEEQ